MYKIKTSKKTFKTFMSKYYTCQLYNYTEYTVVLIIVCYFYRVLAAI